MTEKHITDARAERPYFFTHTHLVTPMVYLGKIMTNLPVSKYVIFLPR